MVFDFQGKWWVPPGFSSVSHFGVIQFFQQAIKTWLFRTPGSNTFRLYEAMTSKNNWPSHMPYGLDKSRMSALWKCIQIINRNSIHPPGFCTSGLLQMMLCKSLNTSLLCCAVVLCSPPCNQYFARKSRPSWKDRFPLPPFLTGKLSLLVSVS